MARLEDITVGSTVKGIAGNEPVSIVAVQWYGTNVIDITYKNSQNVPGTQLLYREDEYHIEVMDNNLPWSFDADGEQMKLASEAYRISLAHYSTRILQYIHPLLNPSRIKSPLYIRKCFLNCRFDMFWRTIPAQEKQS